MSQIRGRITDKLSKPRLRLEARRARTPLIVLLIGGLVGTGCWAFLISKVGADQFASTYQARFAVRDASGVVVNRNDVLVKGIVAGVITKVEREGDQAVITTKIRTKYRRIFRDARAELRPKTALQDMYLDVVDRGTERAGVLEESEPLPVAQTKTPVRISEVLQVFTADTRKHLTHLLAELGAGMDDRGVALRASFQELVPLLVVAGRLSDELARRTKTTRRLVRNFSVLTGELGSRNTELRSLVDDGSVTLDTLGSKSTQLASTLENLPPTLERANSALTALHDVIPPLNGAVDALQPVASELPRALTAVRALSKDAAPALSALDPAVKRLLPLSAALRPLSSDVAGSANALQPLVPKVDHIARSTADCAIAIYGFFHNTASLLKLNDARGPVARGDFVVDLASAGGKSTSPATKAMKNCASKDTPVKGGKP